MLQRDFILPSKLLLPLVFSEIKIWVPDPDHSELPALWWDAICDKCLLLGIFKHGTTISLVIIIIILWSVVIYKKPPL